MIAFKFLAPGAIGPFSGSPWPVPVDDSPGEWVHTEGPPQPCIHGVRACAPDQLCYWLNDELWRLEISEPVTDSGAMLVGERGRLLARVRSWDEALARDFAERCAERAHELVSRVPNRSGVGRDLEEQLIGFANDADTLVGLDPFVTPYVAAHAAGLLVADERGERAYRPAFEEERRSQAQILGDMLDGDPAFG